MNDENRLEVEGVYLYNDNGRMIKLQYYRIETDML